VGIESVLEDSAARGPDRTALVCGTDRRSYGLLDEEAERLAAALQALGVERGARIAICLDNGPEAVIALFGVLKAGAAFVCLHPTTKPEKLVHVLDDAGAVVLVTSARKLESLEGALRRASSLRAVIAVGKLADAEGTRTAGRAEVLAWPDLLSSHAPNRSSVRPSKQDLAGLLYTSGSTGKPKGVVHTHGSLGAAMRSIAEYLEASASDVVLSVLPLSFGYGLTQLLPTFLAGGTLVLERSFAFPQVTLQRLASERATGFAMVPTTATILLQNDLARFDLSALRYVTNAGAGIAPDLLRELRRRLPRVRIFPMYGQTECIRVTYLPPEEVDRLPTSVGKGMPNQEMWIVDESGRRLPPGSTGELVLRGEHVMREYWNLPLETSEKLRPGPVPGERVLHTGDLFRVDAEGWYHFVSRKDDIIKTRGEKVSPREVENVLQALEGVLSSAVIGTPDPVLGESVHAFVVRKPDSDLDERAVLRHCARHLEDFAVPKRVEFLEDLPQTANAKVDRRALRERGGAA
jgi:amino acid adenylation domain-containing protein